MNTDGLYVIDYGFGEESRRERQKSVSEFVAETHVAYVTQGEKLREHIEKQTGSAKLSWATTYEIFRRNFDGIEYEQGRQIPTVQET